MPPPEGQPSYGLSEIHLLMKYCSIRGIRRSIPGQDSGPCLGASAYVGISKSPIPIILTIANAFDCFDTPGFRR